MRKSDFHSTLGCRIKIGERRMVLIDPCNSGDPRQQSVQTFDPTGSCHAFMSNQAGSVFPWAFHLRLAAVLAAAIHLLISPPNPVPRGSNASSNQVFSLVVGARSCSLRAQNMYQLHHVVIDTKCLEKHRGMQDERDQI